MLHSLQNDLAHAVRSGLVESIPGLIDCSEATLLQVVNAAYVVRFCYYYYSSS